MYALEYLVENSFNIIQSFTKCLLLILSQKKTDQKFGLTSRKFIKDFSIKSRTFIRKPSIFILKYFLSNYHNIVMPLLFALLH